MTKLLAILSLSFFALFNTSYAAQITMAQCGAKVAEFNNTLPMQLDNITTWTNTACVQLEENEIGLVYENQVQTGSAITQTELDTVLPSLIMSWCFGPTLGPLISVVDAVKYLYVFEDGSRIGELNFSFQDCIANQ